MGLNFVLGGLCRLELSKILKSVFLGVNFKPCDSIPRNKLEF